MPRWRLWTQHSFDAARLMNANFWRQIHGGSTHLPVVLLLTSVASALTVVAGYSGGEMLLAAEAKTASAPSALGVAASAGPPPTEGETTNLVTSSDRTATAAAG